MAHLTSRNHYVPIWYQKRFITGGKSSYYYLNLGPRKKRLEGGKIVELNSLFNWGPKKCFWDKDLYTTRFLGIPNDEIERHLFGAIDTRGAKAIDALVTEDYQKLSKFYTSVFEYIDAQKIRTPKGLDWLKAQYPDIRHNALLMQMQSIRQMHCTMWVEGVQEIISARNSSVKFIISDHPVTIYHKNFQPTSKICQYPNDPLISRVGSQTIFPLDFEHCLIITNLEYARNPHSVNLNTDRTNVRYFGYTIGRWDIVIRSKELKEEDVVKINYIIKKRARKYIAASEKEWLYPEKQLKNVKWNKLGSVLLPPENELYHFGGEIFVGGKDGKLAHYQDEFGRLFKDSLDELEEKIQRMGKVGRNSLCPCGSGKKFKRCCSPKLETKKSILSSSFQKRNRIFFNAINDILGFSAGKDWVDIRKDFNDDQIVKLHEIYSTIWGPGTDIINLLKDSGKKPGGFYFGINHPRLLSSNILSYALYADKITVINPFLNSWHIADKYNPTKNPTQYRAQTIKNIAFFLLLYPLIARGDVDLIPSPYDFMPELMHHSAQMAKSRTRGWKPKKADIDYIMPIYRADHKFIVPDEFLLKNAKESIPELKSYSDEKLKEILLNLKSGDPFAPLTGIDSEKDNAQMTMIHSGVNLETAFFIAQVLNSYIFTDIPLKWNELIAAQSFEIVKSEKDPWQLFIESVQHLKLRFFQQVLPEFICFIKDRGRLNNLRVTFADFISESSNMKDIETTSKVAKKYSKLFADEIERSEIEWEKINNDRDEWIKRTGIVPYSKTIDANLKILLPYGGFSINDAYQLSLLFGGSISHSKSIPFSMFLQIGQDRFTD